MAFFFIPILLLRHHLYRVDEHSARGTIPLLDAKRGLSELAVLPLPRGLLFRLLHHRGACCLRRFSVRQDRDGNPRFTITMRKVAFVGLPLFALCLTFGAFDWLMGLNYHWFSTMWGPYIFAGAAGSSMSLLVLVITALRKAGYLQGRRHDRALPHHGEMDARLHRFLGLHRLQPIHALLVREHSGGDAIFHPAKHRIVVAPEHSSGRRPVLCAVRDSASALDQETSASALLWPAGSSSCSCSTCTSSSCRRCTAPAFISAFWIFFRSSESAATLGFFYLRIVGKTSLFPVRDPRLIESLRLTN